MSKIKSFSVGDGDMFYINHGTDNFTIIDCCTCEDNIDRITEEIKKESKGKGIHRFISTHPDDDHLQGLKALDKAINISNFYCVENSCAKEDETDDFKHYCELKGSGRVFHLKKGCSRRWMNQSSQERGSSGLTILWPDTSNEHYKEALGEAADCGSPNNISPIIKYSVEKGVTVLLMGDLETDFMENIKNEIVWPKVDILFAPHHGRDSGKIPEDILEQMEPKIIVIGEAPAKDLNYYAGFNTITQNSAGDITFDCHGNKVHVYCSEISYGVDFLDDQVGDGNVDWNLDYYIGTFTV